MNFFELGNYMDRLVLEYNVPGVDCIVYKEHEMVFRYFTGMRDVENNLKMDGNELFLIFSMTKMLTCTAALQLFEKGKFMLNDPISLYLPEFEHMRISDDELSVDSMAIITGKSIGESVENTVIGFAKNPIRIIDLFTMSAGLDYDLNAAYIKKALADGKTSTRELAYALSETVLGFEPGTRYRYSLCHDVLGALVEVVSGKKFSEYMKENIFSPLGMKNTFFGISDKSKYAARYTSENGMLKRLPLECQYNLSPEYESGGAGLSSCASDYAIFLDALACGGVSKNGYRILSQPTVELMGTNHLKGMQLSDFSAGRPGYGYGLGVRTHIDKTMSGSLSPIGEFGWDGAAGGFSMVDTKNKLSLTYFQHDHSWNLRMQTEMRNVLYKCLDD